MHISVGIIIKDDSGKILMIDRKVYPYGWGCPAGHADKEETPEMAIKREAKEEVGLKIKDVKLLYEEYIPWNECVKGERGHYWYVYTALDWKGKEIRNKREVKDLQWIPLHQIKNLNLEPIWKYWLEKFL